MSPELILDLIAAVEVSEEQERKNMEWYRNSIAYYASIGNPLKNKWGVEQR